jgi:cation transport regulator ChaC
MLYNDIVTVYAKGSRNAYGEREFGASQDVKARATVTTQEVMDLMGDKKLAELEVWTAHEDIEIGQKIEYLNQEYLVLQVFKVRDERGKLKTVKFLCSKYG